MLRSTAIFIVALSAVPAAAQDFYIGGAYDYGLPHSGEAQGSGTVIAGVEYDAGNFIYAFEGGYGTPVSGAETRDTMRLRARAGYDFGEISAFASGGATRYDATNGVAYDGYNFGVGAELDFNESLSLRGEFIRDIMDDGYVADVTTTRIGVFFQF